MKVRLWGTAAELAAATKGLQPGSRCTLTLTVQAISGPYADRGKSTLARVYVEATQVSSGAATPAPKKATGPAASPAPPLPPASTPKLTAPPGVPLEIPKGGGRP